MELKPIAITGIPVGVIEGDRSVAYSGKRKPVWMSHRSILRHHIDRFLRISGNAKLSIQLRPTKTSLRELFQPSWISNLFCTTTYPFENIQISKGLVSDESSSRCRSAVNRQSFI